MSCSKSLRGVVAQDSRTNSPLGSTRGSDRWRVGACIISNWRSADLRSKGGKCGGVVSGLTMTVIR